MSADADMHFLGKHKPVQCGWKAYLQNLWHILQVVLRHPMDPAQFGESFIVFKHLSDVAWTLHPVCMCLYVSCHRFSLAMQVVLLWNTTSYWSKYQT